MKVPVDDYLQQVLGECAGDEGEVADYIPELAAADPDRLAVALCVADGTVYAAGDADVRFSIQSISKPFVYALALADRGQEAVLDRVGVEPSGDAFNEISLEEDTGRPRNPMINVGAITTHALVGGDECSEQDRCEQVRAGLSAFAGRELSVDEAVFASEMETADRNLALAHLVRSHDIIAGNAHETVRGYVRQCALLVDVRDLAVMAMTLAAAGRNPLTGEQVVPEAVCRQVLSVMATCGMYDAAGDWLTNVGIPAKSGVAGGIIGALPGQVGIGTFSPRLDRFGNSARGVNVCERLSNDMGLHLMSAPPLAVAAVRESGTVEYEGQTWLHAELQGPIRFAAGESVLRALAQLEPGPEPLALDLSRVTSVDDVGRRMLLEGIRRLTLDGHDVVLVDPRDVLPDPDAGDGIRPQVRTSSPYADA
ncbi:glutaminase [Kineosphaera limosa]|uniref:Glutaminase n=1 Tax=Kineosphaera limosa NBRC 100340 TaxID=1184609 RepID=K6WAU7_9MICO|nr:glutaminase [Kineosphaera limosa]NYD99166.1 glutaminase [Kineosphaera limosa]GAB96330.1 glutaminase [Kineosphaera limosa NBRC 100340]